MFDGQVLLGLDGLGLRAVAQRHVRKGDRAGVWQIRCVLVDDAARCCSTCGALCRVRSSWQRRLVHAPVGLSAVHLLVRVRRYECRDCSRSWCDDLSGVVPQGRLLTEAAVWWAAAEIVMSSKSVLACARQLCCAWESVNDAVLAKARDCLLADPHRLDGVEQIGVDEHVWRHTAFAQPVRDRHRRPHASKAWRDGPPAGHGRGQERAGVLHVAFGAVPGVPRRGEGRGDGRVRADTSGPPPARFPRPSRCPGPFHIVKLAGDKLTAVRCRLQHESTGRRGTRSDPLHQSRRALLKTACLRTERQRARVASLLAETANQPLKLVEGVYQKIITCYREPNRRKGRGMMAELIESLATPGSAPGCPELATLGRTLKRRMSDILAFFDHEYSANGPTEAINGRLETLRGIALGFRNLGNYITRSLLHTGGFRQAIHTKI